MAGNGVAKMKAMKMKMAATAIGPADLPSAKLSELEFADMGNFLHSLDSVGVQHGAFKVTPPDGYTARSSYDGHDPLFRCCASQTAEGDDGLYTLKLEDAGSMYMSDVERILTEAEAEESKWPSDQRVAEIEFWRNVGTGDSPIIYTAQSINSSLFDKTNRPWNLNSLRLQVPLLPSSVLSRFCSSATRQ